jgi:RNA polymerase sigma-B factor
MASQAKSALATPRQQLRLEAFITLQAPKEDLVLRSVNERCARPRPALVTMELKVSRPEAPVDFVAVREAGAEEVSCTELCRTLRPGGRLLTHVPVEESTGLWPLDETRQLFYKPRAHDEVPEQERGDYNRALVTSHLQLARALARRFEGRGEPREDLEQVAVAALTACARRYDPERGVPFGGYAAQNVLGELKRHFRDRTWGVHVTRPVQERYLALKQAKEHLSQHLGREPSVTEVAAHLHATDEQILEAMEAGSSYWPLQLDKELRTGGIEIAYPEDPIELATDLDNLRAAIPRLPPLERLAIQRYFFEERTQQSIASEIGVSQMQVSRILSHTVARLRESFVET